MKASVHSLEIARLGIELSLKGFKFPVINCASHLFAMQTIANGP
jgi:hypothetical protein